MRNVKEEYIQSEFKIEIVKQKGKAQSNQTYYGTQRNLAVGIAVMFEQLMLEEVFTFKELENLLELAKKGKNGELNK